MMQQRSFFVDPIEAKNFFDTNGYFIERDVLDQTDCTQLINEAHNLVEDGFNLPPLIMPHRSSKLFLHQLRNQKLTLIMSKLLGGDISGLQSQFFFSKPGTKGFSSHQDNFFVEAKQNVFGSIWCPLVDVDTQNGCLYIYPGTNNEGTLPVRKAKQNKDLGQDRNSTNEECIIPNKYNRLDVCMEKGSALFIHGDIVHGSNKNSSQNNRYVSLNTYIIKGETFRKGATAKREEVEL